MAATERVSIPRDPDDDYSDAAKRKRLDFLREHTGASLDHVAGDPIDPPEAAGNVEHFIGAAQVPLGVAGPCWSTASTPRVSSTCRWPPPRARWWPPTTAACACCTRRAA